jgi:trk system potassium uptake protein TrkA
MTQWWQWQASSAQDVSNSFAVIGVGRFGSSVCRELTRAGAEVLAIDLNSRAIDELLQDETGIEARIVDCTDEDALRAAGALDVGIVKDAPETRVQQVIARATSDLHEKMLRRVGADRVVFPSKMQGARLGQELVRPNLLERLRLDDSNSIEEIKVPQEFIGRSLRDLNLRKTYRVNVLAAGAANQLMVNPPASHVLREGEVLVVMGSAEALEALPSR